MYHNYPDDFGQGDNSPNYIRNFFGLATNEGISVDHEKGEHQRDLKFCKDVRQKKLKTIWKKK